MDVPREVTERTIPHRPVDAGAKPGPQDRRRAAAKSFSKEFLLPTGLGLAASVILYVLVLPLLPDTGMWDTIRGKLTNSFVPYVCTMLLFWHLSYVLVRYLLKIRPEFRVLGEDLIPAGANELSDEDLRAIARRAVETERLHGGNILSRRILLAVARLGIKKDTAELGDLLRQRADADRMRTESAYALSFYVIWVIPILGFVGTVLGIGKALLGLKGSLVGMEDLGALVPELGKVTEALGIAFDTTLVGLAMSAVAMLVQTLVQHREERLLADVEDYLTYRLQSRIRSETEESQMSDSIGTALDRLAETSERLQREQGERAGVALKAAQETQESLRNTMSLMPQVLGRAAGSSASVLQDAVKNQLEVSQRVARGLQENAEELRSRIGDDLKEVASTLGDSMKEVAGQLAQVFRSGEQLTSLQTSMRDNLEEAVRVRGLSETLTEVQQSLGELRGVLQRLDRPIPLRFTIGGMELPTVLPPRGAAAQGGYGVPGAHHNPAGPPPPGHQAGGEYSAR